MTESLMPADSVFVPYDIWWVADARAQVGRLTFALPDCPRLTRPPAFAYIAAS